MEVESRILNNARDLFFRYGLKNVTMDEIAADLGMSKKTLYEFYPNKKEIINRITENFLSDQNDAHQQVSAKSKDAVDELIQLMGLINHIFENLDVRVIYDMQRYYPEAWNIFLKHKEDFIMRDITLNLKRGIQEGLFRNDIH
ncbi:MAG: TetR/AcrR family transcriptional regulator, partial [Cyclobacteriaceae bacterium]|nr:TetR/AcrR family transcriptional regulator [Cyclobacteriaceae bacterium]